MEKNIFDVNFLSAGPVRSNKLEMASISIYK